MIDPQLYIFYGYFMFQSVVHDWFINFNSMFYSVFGILHIRYPLLFIGKSGLLGTSVFSLRPFVNKIMCLTSSRSGQSV